MSKVKLNKVELKNVKNVGVLVVEKKVDNRTNNPGRPVNKQSARYKRLAKQAFYADVNNKFVSGKPFQLNGSSSIYKYKSMNDGKLGCIVETAFGMHTCNVSYIGRTKVQGYAFVMSKKVNIELNLKTLKFVK
tara:strand:+ start:59 stop:457 length:399 start_codon:yes stop_codon:yes gene_type:complete